MAEIIPERMAGHIEGDFVVFIIGARVNKWWKPHKWLPVVRAMPRMIKELSALPSEETGFLGYTSLGPGVLIQYWRSFDHLEAYARAHDKEHWPAWTQFNKRMKNTRGDVGIWHETYLVKDGQYEAIYGGMPRHGLGAAAELIPATGSRNEARARLSA